VTSASQVFTVKFDRDSSFVSDEFITAPSLKQTKKTAPSLKKKVICLRLAASQHRAQQKTGILVALFFFTLPQLTIQNYK
jgi:hypothetical protein